MSYSIRASELSPMGYDAGRSSHLSAPRDAHSGARERSAQSPGMRVARALSPCRSALSFGSAFFACAFGVAQSEVFVPVLDATLRMTGNLLGGLDPASLDFFVAALQRPLV